MAEPKDVYEFPEQPRYRTEIRKLRASDPASANSVFNPLLQTLVENTHFVHELAAAIEKALNQALAESASTHADLESRLERASAAAAAEHAAIRADAAAAVRSAIAAIPTPDVSGQIGAHNSSSSAHAALFRAAAGDLNAHAARKDNPHEVTAAQVGAAAAAHTHTAAQAGAVPTTRKVNGKPLSADITLSASDVGAAAATHSHTASSVGTRPSTWTPSAADVGAVPTTRKVNGKPLSADVSLSASDVGAAAASHTHTLSQITGAGNCQIYNLSYTGDGGGSKTVTFPHKPIAVFVQQVELPCYEMRMLQGSKCCFCHGPMTEWPSNVSWSGKSVTWSKVVDDRYSYSVEYMCNTSGKAYRLIALLDAAQ